MDYQMLVTDLDGTLLDADGRVHRRDRLAIAELARRGTPVSLCTGRMYSGTRAIARELGIAAPVGCLDGSHIVDAANDSALHTRSITSDAADTLVSILGDESLATFVFADDAVFHDPRGEAYLSYLRSWSNDLRSVGDVFATDASCWAATVAALITVGNEQQIRDAERAIADHGCAVQTVSYGISRGDHQGAFGMLVRAEGVTKATALAWLAEHHGVAVDQVVAVGDWLNDVPMLKAAGLSFAMAQAMDEVKEAADEVLVADHFAGGGIAEAAERAGLL